jgi:hypothetical protein
MAGELGDQGTSHFVQRAAGLVREREHPHFAPADAVQLE